MNNVNNDHLIKRPQPKAVASTNKNSKLYKNSTVQDIRESDYLHKVVDADSKNISEKSKQGFFAKLWDSIKTLFGLGKETTKIAENTKVYIDDPSSKNAYTPKILIYDGLVDMSFVEKNIDKYIFLFSGNLNGTGGRYGQSSALRPAKAAFPESIVEIPVTRAHANVLDPSTLKEVSYKEDTNEELAQNLQQIEAVIDDAISRSSTTGKTLLMLKGGYGTGGARMYAFAPKTFKGMNKLFEKKLGVRNMLSPLHAKYTLEYVNEKEIDPQEEAKDLDEADFSPEAISKDLWANGWSLTKHNT